MSDTTIEEANYRTTVTTGELKTGFPGYHRPAAEAISTLHDIIERHREHIRLLEENLGSPEMVMLLREQVKP